MEERKDILERKDSLHDMDDAMAGDKPKEGVLDPKDGRVEKKIVIPA